LLHAFLLQVQFYTLPIKLLGKDPETTPQGDSWALDQIKWDVLKHREPREDHLCDYMGHLLGYKSCSEAAAAGVYIVCLRVLQHRPLHSLVFVRICGYDNHFAQHHHSS
jgi:hypothetical protein